MLLFNDQSRRAAALLAGFGIVIIAAVSALYWATQARIDQAQTQAELALYQALVPELPLDAEWLSQSETLTINGKTANHLFAADTHFIRISTQKGYNGNITLLIAVDKDWHTLRGVRVLAHKETPGLGDKIEAEIHPWILGFAGKNLDNTRFAVKKDGGDFDAFTGATITPRAVTNLVGEVLHARQKETKHE